jgi:hypothetical protein
LISYKISDAIKWSFGGSIIAGEYDHTMFGQFQNNSNIFTRVRYSF